MIRTFLMILAISVAFGIVLKDDGVPGIKVEIANDKIRLIAIEAKIYNSFPPTIKYGSSKTNTLWVDRNHHYPIAENISLSRIEKTRLNKIEASQKRIKFYNLPHCGVDD